MKQFYPKQEDNPEAAGTGAAPAGAQKVKKPKAAKKPAKPKVKAKKAGARPKGAKAGKGIAKTTKGPAALREYAPEYHKDNEKKTAGGNVSVDSNDEIAIKLRGKSLDEVYKLAGKALAPDFTEADLRKKYRHLNVGMQRMNLGNRIRAAANAK